MSQGSLYPKITFLCQKVCSVAREQTDTHTRKWIQMTPFRDSGIYPSTYHQGSVQYKSILDIVWENMAPGTKLPRIVCAAAAGRCACFVWIRLTTHVSGCFWTVLNHIRRCKKQKPDMLIARLCVPCKTKDSLRMTSWRSDRQRAATPCGVIYNRIFTTEQRIITHVWITFSTWNKGNNMSEL